MSGREHHYAVSVEWTGNRGQGTTSYRAFGRDHVILAAGKPELAGSSDPAFLGDPARWNPEELLVAALSACHKLWYLHLCSANGISVQAYRDLASGTMIEDHDGGGRFVDVLLRPHVTVAAGDDVSLALKLHHDANRNCFIANSVAFAVRHEPTIDRLTD